MIDSRLYDIHLDPAVWILLGAMALCFILIAAVIWPKLRRVARRVALDDEEPLPAGGYPSVSVVVYSQTDATNLRTLIPQILEQDYPAPMEVIVVNDEGSEQTESTVSELELRYSNLYMTFAPLNSRNLSRRKLAITLGVKAARYDVLLLTRGNCRIDSPLWLRSMMRHIAAGKEVVIGYAEQCGPDDETPDTDSRRRRRAFDLGWESVRYLSSAICRRPFMADGCNLAYLRRLFFAHKGFSQTLNLTYGDDDLFVNEITTPGNTAVELGHDARVRVLEPEPAAAHDNLRLIHEYTSRMLPRRSYLSMGFTSLLWWLWIALGAAAVVLGLPSLVPAAAVLVLGTTFCLINAAQWRRTLRSLSLRPLFWTVIFMALTHPFRTLRHRLRSRRAKAAHVTRFI